MVLNYGIKIQQLRKRKKKKKKKGRYKKLFKVNYMWDYKHVGLVIIPYTWGSL